MDINKKKLVFDQYINQYQPVIVSTLNALRGNSNSLHIPYVQFLFSVIDYYGLIYRVAEKNTFKKRDPDNFKEFLSSTYFPENDRCKASLVYFVRNGIVHQIFAKGCGINISSEDVLFYKDNQLNIPVLNIRYLEQITISAVNSFIHDLGTNERYIENISSLLLESNYGFNDHLELNREVGDDINRFYSKC